MKTRINYITFDSWWDTDITIIPELSNTYEVSVYCLNYYKSCKYPQKLLPQNIKFYQLKQKYRTLDIRSLFCSLRFFFYSVILCRNKKQVFFVTPVNDLWLSLLYLLFLPKSRTIISSHNYVEHGDTKGVSVSLFDKIREMYYKEFKYFHFYSKEQMEFFKKEYPQKKAFYTDMMPKDFGEAKIDKRDDSKVVLLFFGLIRDYKRLDWLIKAVNQAGCTNFKVVIAGKASEGDKKEIENLIGNSRFFDLHFGFIKNEDIPKYFVNSDFLVLPYKSATQSGPSLIAINYGIPIIASDVPAFKDLVIDGKNGFLFNKDSLSSLVDVLKRVANMTVEDIMKMKEAQKRFKQIYVSSNSIEQKFYSFISDEMKLK